MEGLSGRPQDHLGSPIAVDLSELGNDDPHRTDKAPDRELVAALEGGAKFPELLVVRSTGGRLSLLGGERRFYALQHVKRQKVRVYVARDLNSLLAWLQLDAERGGGKRMTRSEVGAFAAKAQFQLRLSSREIGVMDRFLADLYDYTFKTVQDCRQLTNRYGSIEDRAERDRIRADFTLVDQGLLAPSSAVARMIMRRKQAEWRAASMPAPEQVKILHRVLPGLRGTMEALSSMGAIDPDMPADVRAKAAKELTEAYRLLSKIAKALKSGTTKESE